MSSSGDRYIPLSKRRGMEEMKQKQIHAPTQIEPVKPSSTTDKSLFHINLAITKKHGEKSIEDKIREEEEYLLQHMTMEKQPLLGRKQIAGHEEVKYEPIETGWTPPKVIRDQTEEQHQEIRKLHNITCSGEDRPPAIESFKMMRLPQGILNALQEKGILTPKPIQMQGLTVALAGRDMIGIAQTGGGKTFVFALPLVTLAMREEIRDPFRHRQGPFGLILVPQRELAEQIYNVVEHLCLHIHKHHQIILSSVLAIGGVNMSTYWQRIPHGHGYHCLVATPGKLMDLVRRKQVTMERCKYLTLDEADRLVTDQFEEDIRNLLDQFTQPRQTILFSATMPERVKELSKSALVNPIIVNVGQAGTANRDIIQEVEFVPESLKLNYLLSVLEKTAPPVLVFANSQSKVDLLYEYLIVKGLDVGCIHSGIDQEKRSEAVQRFKNGELDILVSTDLLSKGIDFENKHIEHVINYEMPDSIENYIHRIGRTGRAGRLGIATTLIDHSCEDGILLDLKYLLKDAQQKIPPFLMTIYDPLEGLSQEYSSDGKLVACQLCGALGHRAINCPKVTRAKRGGGRIDTITNDE